MFQDTLDWSRAAVCLPTTTRLCSPSVRSTPGAFKVAASDHRGAVVVALAAAAQHLPSPAVGARVVVVRFVIAAVTAGGTPRRTVAGSEAAALGWVVQPIVASQQVPARRPLGIYIYMEQYVYPNLNLSRPGGGGEGWDGLLGIIHDIQGWVHDENHKFQTNSTCVTPFQWLARALPT